ncbi:hypothetical protein NKI61_20305 [Mesorhizobium sp. M0514]|uniref:hypothetical protein n=1 Tax=Mesorhizobium sp. M0514 TaxID=2956955 RepID=UPI00333882B1
MTPSQAVEFATAALAKVRDKVLVDYEATLKKQDINEREISVRLATYRRQMEIWFQRSIDGVKRRYPVH